jgi:hypothetical protein
MKLTSDAKGTDAARRYLAELLRNGNGSNQYADYIRHELAGDFAWELVNRLLYPNVAQGAEAVYQQQYRGEGVWRDMPKDKWDEKQAGILASDQRFRIVYTAPPAQTALTATCGQLIAACTAYNEEMRKRNTANVGMAAPDAMRKAIDAAMTAAQSASGETKCGQ